MPIRRRRYKRNGYRKSYVPSIYRRRSAFTSNYFRCKIDVCDIVGVNIGTGGGLEYMFAHGTGLNASPIFSISDMLNLNAHFARLADVFALCKIKGISVELVPCQQGKVVTYPVVIAYFNSSASSVTYSQVVENPNSMMLDPTKKKYKYISLLGDTGDWKPVVSGSFDGRFVLNQLMAVPAPADDNAKFNIKFSIYMLFKEALA